MPALPPRLRAKLERLEIWLVLLAGYADVVQRADGDEDEGEADHLKHAPEGDGAEGGVEIEAGEVVYADGGDQVAEADHEARIEFCRGCGRRRTS